jgi:hypothetical protein
LQVEKGKQKYFSFLSRVKNWYKISLKSSLNIDSSFNKLQTLWKSEAFCKRVNAEAQLVKILIEKNKGESQKR